MGIYRHWPGLGLRAGAQVVAAAANLGGHRPSGPLVAGPARPVRAFRPLAASLHPLGAIAFGAARDSGRHSRQRQPSDRAPRACVAPAADRGATPKRGVHSSPQLRPGLAAFRRLWRLPTPWHRAFLADTLHETS